MPESTSDVRKISGQIQRIGRSAGEVALGSWTTVDYLEFDDGTKTPYLLMDDFVLDHLVPGETFDLAVFNTSPKMLVVGSIRNQQGKIFQNGLGSPWFAPDGKLFIRSLLTAVAIIFAPFFLFAAPPLFPVWVIFVVLLSIACRKKTKQYAAAKTFFDPPGSSEVEVSEQTAQKSEF